jgi:O-antigen ligase
MLEHDATSSRSAWLVRAVLSVLFVYFVLLGSSEPSVFSTPLRLFNAVVGAAFVVAWAGMLRRGSDKTDALAMAGLVAFLLACAASAYPRQSFDAATSALVWAAAFGVTRRVLISTKARVLCFELLGLIAIVFTAMFAIVWGFVWVEWIRVMGSTPPLDIHLSDLIYRSRHIVAMILAALIPAVVYLARVPKLRILAASVSAVMVLLAIISGSRTAWLGALVGGVSAVFIGRVSTRVVTLIAVAASTAGVFAVGTGVAASIVERGLESLTVSARWQIWTHTLELWTGDLLTGIGPGAFGIGITQTDLMATYPFHLRSPDNAIIELAAEAGVLGLAGAALLIASVIAGRRADKAGASAGVIGLIMLATFTLTHNPTDNPTGAALIVVYAALVAPYAGDRRPPIPAINRGKSLRSAATTASLAVIAMSVVATSFASIMHYRAIDAAREGNLESVGRLMANAVSADPAMALYRREYGATLGALGNHAAAVRELTRAIELNPADSAALRGLAWERHLSGDEAGAVAAARAAVRARPLDPENLAVLVAVSDATSRAAATRELLRLAPWLPGSPAWDDRFPQPTDFQPLIADVAHRLGTSAPPWYRAMAVVWIRAVSGVSQSPEVSGGFRLLADVLACQVPAATTEDRGLEWRRAPAGIYAHGMLSRILADDGTTLSDQAKTAQLQPYGLAAGVDEDKRLYRREGMGGATPGPVIPRDRDALSAWLWNPVGTAQRVAPGTALAACGH